MNHNCGSDDYMEIIDLMTHTCDDNLVNNMSELVDIYWQKEWKNVFYLSCIFWIYFLLGSINTLYLVGNVQFTKVLLCYACFLIFLAFCQCTVLCRMGHWEDYFLDAFNMFDILAYGTMVYFCVELIWFEKLN